MEHKIYNLLEKKNKIICDLIDSISLTKNYTTIDFIANALLLNHRSIQRYINELSDIVNSFNLENSGNIILEYTKFKGVKINYFDLSSDDLKKFILKKDLTINIFLDLIYSRISTIQSYSMKKFLSENLIRKSIKIINSYTTEFSVNTTTREPFFIGEEINIRLFMFVFLWELFKSSPWPFDFISEMKTYKSVDFVSKEARINFSLIHQKQFAYLIAINNLRSRKHYYINKKDEWSDYVNIKYLKENTFFKTGTQEYIKNNEGEVYFYLLLIQAKSKFYTSEKLKSRIFDYHKKTNSDILRLTNLCIKTFTDLFFPIPAKYYEFIFIYIFSINIYCRIFKDIQVDIDGYSFTPESRYHKKLLNKLSIFLNKLYILTNDPIFLNKELLITKYYLMISFFQNIIDYEEVIKISITSDLPLLIRAQLQKEIYNSFSSIFNIHFINNEYENPDLILTNFQTLYKEQYVCPISYPLTEYNIKVIEKHIMKIINDRTD